MINRESKILKLRKVTIYGKLYAIDKDNNDDLYDYKLALKGIPIKIGKLSDKDDSTGKTRTNSLTGKTRTKKGGINKSKTAKKNKKNKKFRKSKRKIRKFTKDTMMQKGGTIYFDRTRGEWIVPEEQLHDQIAIEYAKAEKKALTKLGIGTTNSEGETNSYKPNAEDWYIITDGPETTYKLKDIIRQIYYNTHGTQPNLFNEVESDIASATHGREIAQKGRDRGQRGNTHRFYLNQLHNLVELLREYTHSKTYRGNDDKDRYIVVRDDLVHANEEPSSPKDDRDDKLPNEGLRMHERYARDRGGRKSRKSKKSRKSRKSRKI